jgi:hypothetical protein
VSSLFKSEKLPEPTPPPSVPTLADPSVMAAEQYQAKMASTAYGRQQTILTGGTGVAQPPTVSKKQILGG